MRHRHGELSEGCDEEVGETHGCWLLVVWWVGGLGGELLFLEMVEFMCGI